MSKEEVAMQSRFSLWIIGCAFALAVMPVAAHHGWSGNGEEVSS